MRRLREADHGTLLDEGAGQVVACAVREVLRVSVRTEREVLLEGEQALLQERLFQVTKMSVGIRCWWALIWIWRLL